MADWENGLKADLVRAAKAELAVGLDRVAALQAETLATAGAAARERYGAFCTDLENSLARLNSIRADMVAAGCDAAALARLDSLIASGQTIATARRAIYSGNDFTVKLTPKA